MAIRGNKIEGQYERRPCWVIYSRHRNSIWGRPYESFEEVKQEFDRQMAMLTPEFRDAQDWVIEKKG